MANTFLAQAIPEFFQAVNEFMRWCYVCANPLPETPDHLDVAEVKALERGWRREREEGSERAKAAALRLADDLAPALVHEDRDAARLLLSLRDAIYQLYPGLTYPPDAERFNAVWPDARVALEVIFLASQAPTQEPPAIQPAIQPEDAAILKVLLQAGRVTMTVAMIESKLTIGEKTIRTRLKALEDSGLVEEPYQKKGSCLTLAGQARANNLPTDAGKDLIKPSR